jgi:lysophospholipase L1-like esterase
MEPQPPALRGPAKLGRGKTALFCALPALALLLTGEVALRVVVDRQEKVRAGRALPTPRQRHAYQREDAVLGYALTPGFDGGGIRVNRLGFRGPEVPTLKKEGVFRIVAIGDSCTFGLAGEACPYPARLQWHLRERGDAVAYEVINAGVEGYSSEYGLRLLEARIPALHPDIVTIYIGWNDLYMTDPRRRHAAEPDGESPPAPHDPPRGRLAAALREGLDRLYLAQFLRRTLYLEIPRLLARPEGDRSPQEQAIHPGMAEAYQGRLRKMIRAVRAMGAVPVVMTLPTILSSPTSAQGLAILHYPEWAHSDPGFFRRVVDAWNEAIRAVASDERAVLIDNARFIDALGRKKEALFFDTLHMHCQGYELLAQNISSELARQGLIR